MVPTDLLCASEIADELEVNPSAISNWRKRNVGFPQPWGVWKCGALWLRDDVERWANARADRRAEVRRARRAHLQAELDKIDGRDRTDYEAFGG